MEVLVILSREEALKIRATRCNVLRDRADTNYAADIFVLRRG